MSTKDDPLRSYKEFDENDPAFLIRILSLRVDALTKEKEDLEKKESELERRMAKMENSFQRGAGILMVLPIIGTLVGLLVAYGKVIFKPWAGTP
jgi:flagellar motor component MotA